MNFSGTSGACEDLSSAKGPEESGGRLIGHNVLTLSVSAEINNSFLRRSLAAQTTYVFGATSN